MRTELDGIRWFGPYPFGPRSKVHGLKILLLTDESLNPIELGATRAETTGQVLLNGLGLRYHRGMRILYQDIETDSESDVDEYLAVLREHYELG